MIISIRSTHEKSPSRLRLDKTGNLILVGAIPVPIKPSGCSPRKEDA